MEVGRKRERQNEIRKDLDYEYKNKTKDNPLLPSLLDHGRFHKHHSPQRVIFVHSSFLHLHDDGFLFPFVSLRVDVIGVDFARLARSAFGHLGALPHFAAPSFRHAGIVKVALHASRRSVVKTIGGLHLHFCGLFV